MQDQGFIVQSTIPERLYVKIYHDFLDADVISGKEKLVFILLKRYLNFTNDENGIAGEAYPTMDTISKQANMSRKTIAGIIKKLEKKGIIKITQRGLTKPNIYTLRDFSEIWQSKTETELKEATESFDNKMEEITMIQKLRSKGYTVTKEKELDKLSADQSKDNEPSSSNNQLNIINTTTKSDARQGKERYTMEEIKLLYDYEIMVTDHKFQIQEIDAVMEILHTILNTTKDTIRVGGEYKPTMIVIAKLMKLYY